MISCDAGLIIKKNTKYFVTDLKDYSGVFVISENFELIDKIDSLMWFADQSNSKVYMSDQKRNNYLCMLDDIECKIKIILEKPCFNIACCGDDIFFINEENGNLYRYNTDTKKTEMIINENVNSFILDKGVILYSSDYSLKKHVLRTGKTNDIVDDVPICLIKNANKIFYANRLKQYCLNVLDLDTDEKTILDNVKTRSIAYCENYLYISNALSGLSLERIDLQTGKNIRISSAKADYIQAIDNYLFYVDKNEENTWFKINLTNFRITRLIE